MDGINYRCVSWEENLLLSFLRNSLGGSTLMHTENLFQHTSGYYTC